MKSIFSATNWLPKALFMLLLLSACAPAPGGSSSALRQQLNDIKQQQQQQAEQLQALQEQLEQLQAKSGASSATRSQASRNQRPSRPTGEKIPAYAEAELSQLADSASTYLAAFSNLAAARYAAAENGFELFLRNYPEHQYSANARYWLANAQAAQGKLQAAMSNLRQIVIADSGQQKAPAALVQLAQLYRQQGLEIEADDVLEQLRSRYPDSPEAQHFYQSDAPQP